MAKSKPPPPPKKRKKRKRPVPPPPPIKTMIEELDAQWRDDPVVFLMRETLTLAVPLWMHEFRTLAPKRLETIAHVAGQVIAEKGDILQFRSKKRGETANAFNELARGLAAAALIVPGGITFLGVTWGAE